MELSYVSIFLCPNETVNKEKVRKDLGFHKRPQCAPHSLDFEVVSTVG